MERLTFDVEFAGMELTVADETAPSDTVGERGEDEGGCTEGKVYNICGISSGSLNGEDEGNAREKYNAMAFGELSKTRPLADTSPNPPPGAHQNLEVKKKMGNIFRRSRVTAQDKAVLQLKQQRDSLKQCQKRLNVSLEKEKELLKKLIQQGRKERAMSLLRKKKFQEDQLTKMDQMLDNLERLTFDLEFAQVELTVLEGLSAGNSALKKLHQLISLEDVEKIMDETMEGVQKQKEIDEILSGNLTEEDEEAVLEEYNDILRVEQDISLTDTLHNLPDVPQDLEGKSETEEPEEEKPKKSREHHRRKERQALAE